ncbi:DNA/RNA helicase domain-containing protein [Streptomyces sp. R28]|uniref:DNA/RNA helicase domain-containing protein n=1 Tax=Streptomyces sp. R28 TaxID=3238628 RepID=A0AB39QBC5_9ACTN
MLLARGRLPVIICDDAQLLGVRGLQRETVGGGFSALNTLMDYCTRLVLFVDESRALLPGDLGGLFPSNADRSLQLDNPLRFRFGTRHGDWVTQVLGGRSTRRGGRGVSRAEGVHIAPTVEALEAFLARRWTEGMEVVLAAGHFEGQPLRIGDWQRPWLHAGGQSVFRPTEAETWRHVASVHDVDGLEYDWCGVIMGTDMVWRDDTWVIDPGANLDLRGKPELSERGAGDELVRNAYRCLFTRPSQGLVIFSVDPETRDHLATVAQPLTD